MSLNRDTVSSEQRILGQRLHLDSTSFVLHGRYDIDVPEDAPTQRMVIQKSTGRT